MKLYKFLRKDGSPTHAPDSFRWPLPANGKPGEWISVKGDLIPCENGLHLVRESGLLEWANAQLYEAEHDGEWIEKDENVLVCRKARLIRKVETWNEKNLRLFAADCAERVLHRYEKNYPEDDRPRKAIEVARAYACGEAMEDELEAAWAAARDAAWGAGAARAAARDAAWAAAWAAARDAAGEARDAAREARDAAGEAEREWQRLRLAVLLTAKEEG